MGQKVTVTINPKTGEVTKDTSGFQGAECQEKTQGLDAALGITGSACVLKPEYYETKEQVDQQIGGS
jgi:hypothetical protein